jgi:hypothetical protein
MYEDSFSIGLLVRHPSRSPLRISRALSLKRAGDKFRVPRDGRMYFRAVLQKGNSVSEFERALIRVVKFLRKNESFWKDMMDEKGKVELVLNYAISPQAEEGDKCFELSLTPALCKHLSARGISLRIQGWQGYRNAKRSSAQFLILNVR